MKGIECLKSLSWAMYQESEGHFKKRGGDGQLVAMV